MSTGEATSLRERIQWYATAAAGPMASAGVQFLLSLTLLARLPVAEFGRLSFLFVVSQFSIGIWSALFTSPMLVLSAQAVPDANSDVADRELQGVRAAAQLALLPACAGFIGIAWTVGLACIPALLFGAYATLVLQRQFARVRATAQGHYSQAMASDLTYSALLLAGVGALVFWPSGGVTTAMAILALAVLGGFLPLLQFGRVQMARFGAARVYGAVWRRDARWSLAGVVSTEATVNSHSYIVTGILGPAAYAPIAATVLFIRPITVAVNALVEFERARAAHRVARGEWATIQQARVHLRVLLLAIWIATGFLAALVIALAPSAFLVDKFGLGTVVIGSVLWMGVALARLLHAPEGVILLAAGRFRQLAWISGSTALISIVSVLVVIMLHPPIYSIVGIVLGEGVFAIVAWRATERFLRASARQSS